MENQNSAALFEDRAMEVAAAKDASAVARATQEIQASLVIAQKFPRNEVRAKTKILEACKRKGLAEFSEYEYSRGGQTIVGPTVDLLRAIASRWGNLLFGWDEVERREGQSSVRAWAWDTQSNTRAERTFVVSHWRDTKAGGYELTDDRDIYELVANMAARRVRACMEEIIDCDVIEDAVAQCRKTMVEGNKDVPMRDRVVRMLQEFIPFGVDQKMIEEKFQKSIESLSEIQFAALRRIYKSLRDGVAKADEIFKPAVQTDAPKFQGTPAATPAEPVTPPPVAQMVPVTPPPTTVEEPENPIRALRDLMGIGNFKESDLIDCAVSNGLIPAGITSLEQVELEYPGKVVGWVDGFGAMANDIRKFKKAKKA